MVSTTAVDCLMADAYAFFEQGLCYDEQGGGHQAETLEMYTKGLQLVEQARTHKGVDQSSLYRGLMTTKQRVEERVAELRKGRPSTPSSTQENIRNSLIQSTEASTEDAELVYWLPEGVQLVMIEEGKTAAPSPPCSLAIFRLSDLERKAKGQEAGQKPPLPDAFMQVGPWAYPLIVGQTSVLKNEMGVYVVPNPAVGHPNMFVGIILPRGLDKHLEEEFLIVLQHYSTVRRSEIVGNMSQEQRQRTSEQIARFLVRSGELLAENVQWAANKTGEYIADKGQRYREGIPEREGAPVNINPAVRHGVFFLHKGSKGVARVTRYLLDKIGDVGVAVGNQLVSSVGTESSGGRLIHSTATVLGGGITGVSTVWISLEEASKTLFRNFATETVQTVQVKYGDEASETMYSALSAAGHTTLAGWQLWDFGPRAIAGRMAKKAGIQIVRNMGGAGPDGTTVVHTGHVRLEHQPTAAIAAPAVAKKSSTQY